MEAESSPGSQLPNFDQLHLLAENCQSSIAAVCDNLIEERLRDGTLLEQRNGLASFLTLKNEGDRLREWVAALNKADLLQEALETVALQSEDAEIDTDIVTEIITDDDIPRRFAGHVTLGLLLLSAYLEQLEQKLGIGWSPARAKDVSVLTDRCLEADDANRLGRATFLAQSVLPDGFTEGAVIEMLSESELAPSLPKNGFEMEEMVQGVAAVMDCLCSWTTVLELYQCEEVDHVQGNDKFCLGATLEAMMRNDGNSPPDISMPVPIPPAKASAYQDQPIHRTTDAKPSEPFVSGRQKQHVQRGGGNRSNRTEEESSGLSKHHKFALC
jgi:hypothetical protein